MGRTLSVLLLLLGSAGTLGKYVHVPKKMTWRDAQASCRQDFTDLAAVSNDRDMHKLQGINTEDSWLGLMRLGEDQWVWSGGGNVSQSFWQKGQPDNPGKPVGGTLFGPVWYDVLEYVLLPSLCYRAIVVRQKKTWEDAVDHCRTHHQDLASVASLTELLLLQKELRKRATTDRVWIGLRFFQAEWLWVDGQAYAYRPWGSGGEPACPCGLELCAALHVEAELPDGSCSDNHGVTGCGAGVDPEQRGWRARHCEERRHFVCY